MQPVEHAVYEYTTTRRKIGDFEFTLGDKPADWFPQIPRFLEIIRPYFENLDHERLVCAYFDPGGRMLGLQTISEGGELMVDGSPKLTIRAALEAKASVIVVIHNHANGVTEPSDGDVGTTANLATGCQTVDIMVADSLIVNEDCTKFVSMRQWKENQRLQAIAEGRYIPEAADYNLGSAPERIRAASELRLAASAQTDPENRAMCLRLAQDMEMMGRLEDPRSYLLTRINDLISQMGGDPLSSDPEEAMRQMLQRQMGFDPDGDDGPIN